MLYIVISTYIREDIVMKTNGLAYVLWFFLGTLGIHKFYLRKTGLGILYLILGIVGYSTVWFVVGFIPLAVLAVLLVIDIFTIPAQVIAANQQVAQQVSSYQQ